MWVALGVALVSLATPLISETVRGKWFDFPRTLGLMVLPVACFVAWLWIWRAVGRFKRDGEIHDWRPFLEYMEKARLYLESNKATASQDPVWYELMGLIGQRQSWPKARYVAMLNEGLDRYPFYHQLYFTGLDFYSPRWGGNAKAM